MGTFNAGKSTFLNALLGEALLAADILPATAAVTVLRYGHSQNVELHRNQQAPMKIPMRRLRELSSEGTVEAADMREGLSHIEVSLSKKLLRQVTLVDTPGLNSPYESHTRATKAFIERADAVIWILSCGQPLNDDERNGIESLPQGQGLLVLVNHIDDCNSQQESLEEITDNVQNNLDRTPLLVVPLSAQLALDAIVRSDPNLLADSNWFEFLKAFESEILTDSPSRRLSRLQVKLQGALSALDDDLQNRIADAEKTHAKALGGSDYQCRIREEHQTLLESLEWLNQGRSAIDKVSELAPVLDNIADHGKLSQQLQILKASLRSLVQQRESIDAVDAEIDERSDELDAAVKQCRTELEEYNHSGLFGGAPIFFDGDKNTLEARERAVYAQIKTYNGDLKQAKADRGLLISRFERFEVDCQELINKIIEATVCTSAELVRSSHNVRRDQQDAIHLLEEMSWLKQFAIGATESHLWRLDEAFHQCATAVNRQPSPSLQIDVAPINARLVALAQRAWHVETASALDPPPPVPEKPVGTKSWADDVSRFAITMVIVLAIALGIGFVVSRISAWSRSSEASAPVPQPVPLGTALVIPADNHPAGSRFIAGDWNVDHALSIADKTRTRVTLDVPFRKDGRDRRIVTAAEWGGCDSCKAKTAIFYFSKYQDGWTLDTSNAAFIGEGDFLNSPVSDLVMLGPSRHGIRLTTNHTSKGEGYSETLLGGWAGGTFETLWDGFLKERECSGDGACTSKESVIDLVPGANPEYYDVLVSPVGGWAAKSLYTITAAHDAYRCASGPCANVPDVPHEQLDSAVAKVVNSRISISQLQAQRVSVAPKPQAKPKPVVDPPQPKPKVNAATERQTWTDPKTGLMWARKDDGGNLNWQQADSYCQNLRLGDYSSWRLPRIDELHAIYDPTHSTKGVGVGSQWNMHVRGELLLSGWAWSSSVGAAPGDVWIFGFHIGERLSVHLDGSFDRRALCVRRSGE